MLFKNGTIVTMNPEFDVLQGDLRIQGDTIQDIGQLRASPGEEVIDLDGKVVLPGLIQTHVHLSQTLFRNRAEDLPLLPWLQEKIWPLEAGLTEETTRISAELAVAELLKGGTTSVMTMETVCHTPEVLDAVRQGGIRAVVGKALMDRADRGHPEQLTQSIEESLSDIERLFADWQGAENGRIEICLAPRFALSVSSEFFAKIVEFAEQHTLRIHTHASESKEETEMVRRETGMGNIEYFGKLGLLNDRLCVAHCVWISDREIELLAESGSHVLHCPTANLKLGSGIAPIVEMRDMGVSVSIGADGAPCNNTLDVFSEMKLAGLLQKVRKGADAMPARDIIAMATIAGAHALGQEDRIGSIEIGKKADVTILDLDKPHSVPGDDNIYNRIVYSATPQNVHTVMVDGRVVVNGGTLLTLDEQEIVVRANKAFQ
jgi:5-methylthioadenosine/S-adenosylhomocysteine deaminase